MFEATTSGSSCIHSTNCHGATAKVGLLITPNTCQVSCGGGSLTNAGLPESPSSGTPGSKSEKCENERSMSLELNGKPSVVEVAQRLRPGLSAGQSELRPAMPKPTKRTSRSYSPFMYASTSQCIMIGTG